MKMKSRPSVWGNMPNIEQREQAAMAIWNKLRKVPGPNAVQTALTMILNGEFSADELAFIVATTAMYPLALAEARSQGKRIGTDL